jgi:phosphomannomutase
MRKIFARIRGEAYPKTCGRFKIKNIRDLTVGYDNGQEDHKAILPVSPSIEMITFTFENDSICTLRGSGTEPKLKYYIEARGEFAKAQEVRSCLEELVSSVINEFLQPEANGLIPPSE